MKISGPLMFDLVGLELTEIERDFLAHPLIGGVILFSRNYDNINQLKSLTKSIHAIHPELLICVDQEGGRVQRFQNGFTQLPALAELGQNYKENSAKALILTKQVAQTMATELKAVGVDFSFAPVLDVDSGISAVIGNRSFSDDPDVVAKLGHAYIEGLHNANMIAVGKHFPGHGAVAEDSHVAIPVDHREFVEIANMDLLPFKRLSHELDGIMPAHVTYDKVDPIPAGFSKFWLKDVLREQLSFKGLVFSDDMTMEGASAMGDMLTRTQAALAAGCDMVLICNDQESAIDVLNRLNEQLLGT